MTQIWMMTQIIRCLKFTVDALILLLALFSPHWCTLMNINAKSSTRNMFIEEATSRFVFPCLQ